MKSLLADIKVNEDKLSILVIRTYRYGNWIYYNVKLFGIPATCKIGKGFRLEHGGNVIIIHGESIIEDNVRIGANTVANKDIPSSSTVLGIPARILQQKSVKEIMYIS